MNIKELLEKMKTNIRLGGNVEENFKQSLLQFIDYLIEDLRGKNKKLSARLVPDYEARAYNESIDDQITNLLSIKKEIESISTNESASH
jgi:ssRNA-specific RNase YbeY (16S rRNA maturation enzyme)